MKTCDFINSNIGEYVHIPNSMDYKWSELNGSNQFNLKLVKLTKAGMALQLWGWYDQR